MSTSKTVLVTGANRGIGRAIAMLFAAKGYQVIVGARQLNAAQTVVNEIAAQGGSAQALALDVSNIASVKKAALSLLKPGFSLNALINNAGVNVGFADTILAANATDIEQSLQTNGFGPLEVTKAFLPALKASKEARIVNVSSEAGSITDIVNPESPFAFMEGASYRLSKTMTNGITGLLAKALRNDAIKVNAMCPGWTQTDMGGADAPNKPQDAAKLAFELATLPADGATGGFFNAAGRIAW
jgi:NAD(P)-dependent dehydrogenase (short-subunit alcohol dehydrogenase family)